MKKFLKESLRIILVVGALFGIVALVSAWTPPSTTPPGGNVPAPLNVGTATQNLLDSKTIGNNNSTGVGVLLLNQGVNIAKTFSASSRALFGEKVGIGSKFNVASPPTPSTQLEVDGGIKTSGLETNSFRLTGGSATNNKVLTANADGFGTWQTPSGGGITNSSFQVDSYSISSSVATDRNNMGSLSQYFVCVLSKVKASNPSSATLVTGCEITTADTIYPGRWVLISNSTKGQSYCSAYCIGVK